MNKLWLAALGLGLASFAAVAQQPAQGTVQPRMATAQEQPSSLDVYTVCFYAGVPYSEGAEINGKVCTRSRSGPSKPVTWDNVTQNVNALAWTDKPGFYK